MNSAANENVFGGKEIIDDELPKVGRTLRPFTNTKRMCLVLKVD